MRRGRARTAGQSTTRSASRYETPVNTHRTRPPHTPSLASSRAVAAELSLPGESIASTERPQDPRDDFDADLDAHQEVIMAVNVTERGSVGCAYYVAREEKLSMMEDIQLGGADMVEARM